MSISSSAYRARHLFKLRTLLGQPRPKGKSSFKTCSPKWGQHNFYLNLSRQRNDFDYRLQVFSFRLKQIV